MKIEFERPDYCEGCPIADYRIVKTELHADGEEMPYEIDYKMVCQHDYACSWTATKTEP